MTKSSSGGGESADCGRDVVVVALFVAAVVFGIAADGHVGLGVVACALAAVAVVLGSKPARR